MILIGKGGTVYHYIVFFSHRTAEWSILGSVENSGIGSQKPKPFNETPTQKKQSPVLKSVGRSPKTYPFEQKKRPAGRVEALTTVETQEPTHKRVIYVGLRRWYTEVCSNYDPSHTGVVWAVPITVSLDSESELPLVQVSSNLLLVLNRKIELASNSTVALPCQTKLAARFPIRKFLVLIVWRQPHPCCLCCLCYWRSLPRRWNTCRMDVDHRSCLQIFKWSFWRILHCYVSYMCGRVP